MRDSSSPLLSYTFLLPFSLTLVCGDTTGSIIAKNVITNSLQRCVVIHGTHGVTIDDNVAYKTRGHCYVLEDGSEVDNLRQWILGLITGSLILTKMEV